MGFEVKFKHGACEKAQSSVCNGFSKTTEREYSGGSNTGTILLRSPFPLDPITILLPELGYLKNLRVSIVI